MIELNRPIILNYLKAYLVENFNKYSYKMFQTHKVIDFILILHLKNKLISNVILNNFA